MYSVDRRRVYLHVSRTPPQDAVLDNDEELSFVDATVILLQYVIGSDFCVLQPKRGRKRISCRGLAAGGKGGKEAGLKTWYFTLACD